MARTMLYHRKEFPLGKVFDTETNKADPHISEAPFGCVDSPGLLYMTQDDVIDSIVRKEIAGQSKDRAEIEGEFTKKTGDVAHFAAKDDTLVKVLDTPGVKRGRPRKAA